MEIGLSEGVYFGMPDFVENEMPEVEMHESVNPEMLEIVDVGTAGMAVGMSDGLEIETSVCVEFEMTEDVEKGSELVGGEILEAVDGGILDVVGVGTAEAVVVGIP